MPAPWEMFAEEVEAEGPWSAYEVEAQPQSLDASGNPIEEAPLKLAPQSIPRSPEELAGQTFYQRQEAGIPETPLRIPTPQEESVPSVSAWEPGLWERFRISGTGRALMGPTEAERAGMIGAKPGLLEIPAAMFQMTTPPPQIAQPTTAVLEHLGKTGGPIGAVAAGAGKVGLSFASPALPLIPFANLTRAQRLGLAATVTGPYIEQLPEQSANIARAIENGDVNKAIEIATETGLNGVVAALAPLTAIPKARPRITPTERIPDATQARQIQESVLSERPGVEAQRLPDEAGVSNRLQPAREVTPQIQKGEVFLNEKDAALVNESVKRLADSGIRHEVVSDTSPQYATDVMWTTPDGQIKINTAAIPRWAKEHKLSGEKLTQWFEAGLTHEQIHGGLLDMLRSEAMDMISTHPETRGISPAEAANMADTMIRDRMVEYWNNSTALEKKLTQRAYNRKWKAQGSEYELGHEMFRRQAERFAGLKPTEVIQSKGMEWVTQSFIDMLERGISKARETLGTKASKNQLELLNRYQANVDAIRKAKGWESKLEPSRMEPKEEEKPKFTPLEVDKMTASEFMTSMQGIPDGLTGEAYRIGRSTTTPEALKELSTLRDKYSTASREAMKAQDFDTAMSNSSRSQFYREAYEAATGTGSAGSWLRKNDPNYKPTMEVAEPLRMEPKKEGERATLPSGQLIRTKDGMEATVEKDTGGDTITVMRPSGKTETIPASEVWWDVVKPPTTPTAPSATTTPPTGQPPSAGAVAVSSPNIELARKAKDFHIINNVNSPQWTFMFGRLGEAAKNAIERIFTGEFKMREGVGKDVRVYVEDALASLPRKIRKDGGKAFFDALNGKTIEQIRTEWEGKPGGEKVIAQAEKVKGRLEEIRTTIRDTKSESYRSSLEGMDRETLSELYANNLGQDPAVKTKAQMAQELAALEYPADWGIADGSYLPHLFFGGYKIVATIPGQESSAFISRAKTPSEAKAKIYELTKQNPEYANAQFKVEQDTVIPADMIRLGDKRFWRMIGQMKDNLGVSAAEVKQAQQGIIGRKAAKQKWFGSLQERKGFEGYERDYKKIMTSYLSGFHRWKELSAMQKDVQPLIEQVRSEGRLNAASALDDIMENLWGKPARSTVEFDALVNRIPGLRDIVKPLALERWSRNIRSLAALMTLRTIRFATINRLQPLQGLYPIVGERILAKGKLMQHSPEGRALLDEAGVTYDVSQYGQEGGIVTKAKRLGEKFSGERTNQELAFLSMFIHGTEQGMSRPEAIKYAKLRGQLMTQFTPLVSDIPPAFRGPFGQLAFQFKRFPIKQIELAANLAADKNIPGLARMLAVFAVMGGASYFMRQTYQSNEKKARLRRAFKEELGDKWADAAMYGLPGLLGADISGSIVLGEEPMGDNIYEKIGRQTVGPAASLIYETGKGMLTEARRDITASEKTKAIIRKIPSLRPIAELSDLITGNVDVLTPDGEAKYRRALSDAIAGLGSFRGANEANKQTTINAIMELKKEDARLKNALYVAASSGKGIEPQMKAIRDFNLRWPEAAITADEIKKYINYRRRSAGTTDEERIAGKKFAPLLER